MRSSRNRRRRFGDFSSAATGLLARARLRGGLRRFLHPGGCGPRRRVRAGRQRTGAAGAGFRRLLCGGRCGGRLRRRRRRRGRGRRCRRGGWSRRRSRRLPARDFRRFHLALGCRPRFELGLPDRFRLDLAHRFFERESLPRHIGFAQGRRHAAQLRNERGPRSLVEGATRVASVFLEAGDGTGYERVVIGHGKNLPLRHAVWPSFRTGCA